MNQQSRDSLRTYREVEKFVLSREFFGMKLGLEHVHEYLAELGNPQYRYRTIHVGGTNGKGSTSAMLASVLTRAGYKTGLFTSPHLVDFRERIRVNGKNISAKAVSSFVRRHQSDLVKKKSLFSNC